MRDPHVVALHYKIEHAGYVDYAKAAPFEGETDSFNIRIEQDQATFEMKAHFATVEEARAVVDPYIRRWELHAGLEVAPGTLIFRYDRPEIIERDQRSGRIHEASVTMKATAKIDAVLTREMKRYPAPPKHFVASSDVVDMYGRFSSYRAGKEPIGTMAYYCLTVLEKASDGRQKICEKYGIGGKVITTLGRLSSEKGGTASRKADGRAAPLHPMENDWLEAAIKAIIRRVAEYDAGRSELQKITMADLPKLI
jgi:hypothetical protein